MVASGGLKSFHLFVSTQCAQSLPYKGRPWSVRERLWLSPPIMVFLYNANLMEFSMDLPKHMKAWINLCAAHRPCCNCAKR